MEVHCTSASHKLKDLMLLLSLVACFSIHQDRLPIPDRPGIPLLDRVRTVAAIAAELQAAKGIPSGRLKQLGRVVTALDQTSGIDLLRMAVLIEDKQERLNQSGFRWGDDSCFERRDYLHGAFLLVAAAALAHEAGPALDKNVVADGLATFYDSTPFVLQQSSLSSRGYVELLPAKRRGATPMFSYPPLTLLFTRAFLEAHPIDKVLDLPRAGGGGEAAR